MAISAALRAVFLCVALASAGCTQVEASFKVTAFRGVSYEDVFEICHKNVKQEYGHGTYIRADLEAGHIETDLIQFQSSKGLRWEQAFVNVVARDDLVEVAIFAPISQRVIDPEAEQPVQYVALGSDVKQESLMLDQIIGAVLADFPDAEVVEQ